MADTSALGRHQGQPLATFGMPLAEATAAMILVHGRGANAQSMAALGQALATPGFAYLAPQATGNTWYPQRFTAPLAANEPDLSSALAVVDQLVRTIEDAGVPAERIVLAGFSQGACLAAEYAARHSRRYGGLLLFSGGLIGPLGAPLDHAGSLAGTPVFVGCSDVDSHIPLARVHETTEILTRMGAAVNQVIYPGMDHTIVQDEIDQARTIVEQVARTGARERPTA